MRADDGWGGREGEGRGGEGVRESHREKPGGMSMVMHIGAIAIQWRVRFRFERRTIVAEYSRCNFKMDVSFVSIPSQFLIIWGFTPSTS